MSLNTIYGINGIGKDTVAEELRNIDPDVLITSMSRVLMYSLGISKSCDAREKISEEQYKKLESIPQKQMVELENNEYKIILERMSISPKKVIFLSHLVSALRLGDNIEYLTDRLTPDWFVNLNQNIIQLVAPPEVVKQRRENDLSRKRCISIEEITEHQNLCDAEWERIKQKNPEARGKMFVVENMELKKAAGEIYSIVNNRNMFKESEDGR